MSAPVATSMPMEYHFPGWRVEHDDRRYFVWAPRPAQTSGVGSRPARNGWAAAWDTKDGDDGDYWRSDEASVVLDRLPEPVRAAVVAAIAGRVSS
jgi:hypothetical protein